MRYALIADVHANLHALETVLDALSRRRIDGWICAGDLVGLGAFPRECVHRVLALPAVASVAGNHDRAALGRLSGARFAGSRSMEWTTGALDEATRDALGGLPSLARCEPDVLVAHGSMDDDEEYIATPAAARRELAKLRARGDGARTLVIGHTHHPLAVTDDGSRLPTGREDMVPLPTGRRCLINPGAVGQSRERLPLARAAVLDTERGEVEFIALRYDVEGARAAIRANGLAETGIHVPPKSLWSRALRWGRRSVARRPAGRR